MFCLCGSRYEHPRHPIEIEGFIKMCDGKSIYDQNGEPVERPTIG